VSVPRHGDVQTVDGWACTATVIDLHSRKVVGYAVADHLRTTLIIEALAAALITHRPPTRGDLPQRPRLPVHIPRVRRLLRRERRQRSMGRRATRYDNAVSESFFATYKKELIHTRPQRLTALGFG